MASLPQYFDKFMISEYAAEVMVYFEKHKLLEIIARLLEEISLVRPDTEDRIRIWLGKNITRIADRIYSNCLDITYNRSGLVQFYQLPGGYLYRVVLFGRRGSGRKTQANLLVKRFKLTYIDVEQVILQNLQNPSETGCEFRNAWTCGDYATRSKAVAGIIQRRLVQEDALRQGWVLFNYPNNVEEMGKLFEEFKIPPNKLVYLKCDAKLALRRLVNMPRLGRPQDNCDYMEQESRYFDQQEPAMEKYLARRFETIYVDGTPLSDKVRIEMFAKLERKPYLMGFKQQS